MAKAVNYPQNGLQNKQYLNAEGKKSGHFLTGQISLRYL